MNAEQNSLNRLRAATDLAMKRLDQFSAGWQNAFAAASGHIHCRRGCCNCCTLAVNCSYPEAQVASAALLADHLPRLRQHVHHLADLTQTASSLPAWLRAHRAGSGGCPFLDPDGTCTIYAARPLTCRALLATREPTWCATDFSSLSSQEKQSFMASLDRDVVDFPMHYVAATKQYAEQQEQGLLQTMADMYGFALYGSLPVLIWLEQEGGLSAAISAGQAAAARLLAESGLGSPFLVTMVGEK
jgi:Fe-S-cluster containining protein